MMNQQTEDNVTEMIARGMEIAVEKCLLDKVVKGQSVVYAHSDGTIFTMSAKDALNHFLRRSMVKRYAE